MPKVLDKPHNPAALLLPKRPPASKPQGEQSFDHALKRAQPKREPAAPAKKEQSPAPQASVEAPVDPGDTSAEVNESDTDTALPPVEAEADAEGAAPEATKADPEQEHTEVDAAAPVPSPDQLDLPILQLPQQLPEPVVTEDPTNATPAEVALSPVQIDVLPQPTDELDKPEEKPEPGERASIQPIPIDLAEEDEPEQQTVQLPTQKQPAAANPRPVGDHEQLASIELPESAIDPALPTDSEQPQTDDGAADPEQPKLKVPKSPVEPESTPQKASAQPVPEHAAAKDAPAHTDAPRVVDAPVVKVSTDPKPANIAPLPQPPVPVRTDADFAATNHDQIVSSVRTQLLPNGGSMHIRLDPPELGALQIHVRMVDGVMQASFETTSDQATRLLSHTLSQLKTALETQGVSVDKLQVQQAPREQQASAGREDQQRESPQQDSQAQREQQRRELMNRMWRRMRLGRDPLDMVA